MPRDVDMIAYLSNSGLSQERRNACVCQFYRKVTARIHNKRTLGNSKKGSGRCGYGGFVVWKSSRDEPILPAKFLEK